MSRFLDGPAAGVTLVNARQPMFLRVVDKLSGGKDQWDCLDQLDDVPAIDEIVHVYELDPATDRGVARVQIARPRRMCVLMALGDYHHRADVDGETVRDTEAWRAWVLSEARSRGLAVPG